MILPDASAPPYLRLAASVATLAGMALVGFLTLSPASAAPVVVGDKAAHGIAFLGLILPTAFVAPRMLPIVAGLLMLFGGAIELLQPFVGRTRELADFGMNVLGLGLGASIGLLARVWRQG